MELTPGYAHRGGIATSSVCIQHKRQGAIST